jgi:putative transposase
MRRALVERDGQLSIRRQCRLLSLHRSVAYYQPAETPEEDLVLKRRIDEEYTRNLSKGSRMIRAWLREQGYDVNRKRVQRLMGSTSLRHQRDARTPGRLTTPASPVIRQASR